MTVSPTAIDNRRSRTLAWKLCPSTLRSSLKRLVAVVDLQVADIDWTPDLSKMVVVDGDGGPNNRAVELDAETFAVVTSWGGATTDTAAHTATHRAARQRLSALLSSTHSSVHSVPVSVLCRCTDLGGRV